MILFGHVGISIFLGNFLPLSLFIVSIGSIMPDLIDKIPLFLGLSSYGRFIGHTLFLGILIPLIAHIIFRKKLVSFSLLFGYMLHLLEDATSFVPWFYPFVNYNFSAYTLGNIFNPFNVVSEVVGVFLFIYVVRINSNFRNDFKKFFNNFKINNK